MPRTMMATETTKVQTTTTAHPSGSPLWSAPSLLLSAWPVAFLGAHTEPGCHGLARQPSGGMLLGLFEIPDQPAL